MTIWRCTRCHHQHDQPGIPSRCVVCEHVEFSVSECERPKPRRIQLSRKSGWRKPDGAVVVARPSKWGNPFRVGEKFNGPAGDCVRYFRAWIEQTEPGQKLVEAAKVELRGKDLCCWCALDKPCHADVLLEIANS